MLAAQSDTTHQESPVVYVVDDDANVRRALSRLLQSAGLETREFGSGDELMASDIGSRSACIVAESLMPGGAGIDLPHRLRESGREIPVILLSAASNGQRRAAARSSGALLFFRKPVDGQALIDAVEWALSGLASGRQGSVR